MNLLHSLIWFCTTGRFDPAWVQAVASIALVVLTFVTLIVLFRYAWDTRTLARASAEQINLVKRERDIAAMRNYHVAYDAFLKVQGDLTSLMQSFVDRTFGSKRPGLLYQENWPDVTSALYQRVPDTLNPVMRLGIALRSLDFAIRDYFDGPPTNEERATRKQKVLESLNEAHTLAVELAGKLRGPE